MYFRSISQVSVSVDAGKPNIKFHSDGTLKNAELNIMNLRRGASQMQWEKVNINFGYEYI